MVRLLIRTILRRHEKLAAREAFAQSAIDAGFNANSVLRVNLKDWMIDKLVNGKYQEKQVDTTVVAMLVKYAITKQDDFFAIITGDADILPAISIAYPNYTDKICLVTTHPDELDASHRQTSFSYTQYSFRVNPLYLQNCVEDIVQGNYVYKCMRCKKIFITPTEVPPFKQPHCKICRP